MSNWEQGTKLPLVTSCKQVARLISISFERKLTWHEFLTMRIHLFLCKTCTIYRNQITALRKLFVRHQEVLDVIPPSDYECLDQKAKQRMKDVLSSHK